MNGIDCIADTNALIYLLSGDPCMKPYLLKRIGLSVISEMELLSFPGITTSEVDKLKQYIPLFFTEKTAVFGLSFPTCPAVRHKATARRCKRLFAKNCTL